MRFPLVVIPAAGCGTRMGGSEPKCLRKTSRGVILAEVLHFWRRHADQVVVVASPSGYQKVKELVDYVAGNSCLAAAVATQDRPKGICDAILCGLKEHGGVPPYFAVGLGDCLFDGTFSDEDLDKIMRDSNHGVAVDDGDPDFARSYAVGHIGHAAPFLTSAIEKPKRGLGAYFFRWSALATLERYEGITNAVANLGGVRTVRFEGQYLNVTYPEDLERWR